VKTHKFERLKTPHKAFIDNYGTEYNPVMTLRNSTAMCHVVLEDDSYVAYLNADESGFVPTPYIFPELHEALRDLPIPSSGE
jgi:hypothetical protein